MKVRELRGVLRSMGCRPLRCRGSHETWLTPRGTSLPPIVINHLSDDVSYGVLSKVVRSLRAEGIELRADGTFLLAS